MGHRRRISTMQESLAEQLAAKNARKALEAQIRAEEEARDEVRLQKQLKDLELERQADLAKKRKKEEEQEARRLALEERLETYGQGPSQLRGYGSVNSSSAIGGRQSTASSFGRAGWQPKVTDKRSGPAASTSGNSP